MTTRIVTTYEEFDEYFDELKKRCKAADIARILRYEDIENNNSVFEIIAFRNGKIYKSMQVLSGVEIVTAYYPYQLMADKFEKAFTDLVEALKKVEA